VALARPARESSPTAAHTRAEFRICRHSLVMRRAEGIPIEPRTGIDPPLDCVAKTLQAAPITAIPDRRVSTRNLQKNGAIGSHKPTTTLNAIGMVK